MRGTFGVAFLIAAVAGVPVVAQDGASLSIGDRVPTIDIAHTFQGTPVRTLDNEQTYVLEFWATW